MDFSGYQSTKIKAGKAIIIVLVTLLPPWQFARSAQDAVITHALQQRLTSSERKEMPEPGDIVWISGVVEATPLDLGPGFAAFNDSLRLVERIERYRKSGRHRHWITERQNEWVTADAMLRQWRLDADLIRDGGFRTRTLSPCNDYQPPRSVWRVECPDPYAYDRGDDNRRMSYELTPVPSGRVSLMAAVSSDRRSLMLITANDTYQAPFAILVRGEMDPHDLLAERLHSAWGWMSFWWSLTAFVLGIWMMTALRRSRMRGRAEIIAGSCWRATLAAVPLLTLFAIVQTAFFIPAALGTTAIAALIGLSLWLPARGAAPLTPASELDDFRQAYRGKNGRSGGI